MWNHFYRFFHKNTSDSQLMNNAKHKLTIEMHNDDRRQGGGGCGGRERKIKKKEKN